MAKTINFGRIPGEKDLEWFAKNIGLCNHYTKYSIGGEGWCFTYTRAYEQDNPWYKHDWNLTVDDEKIKHDWNLTVDDEKMLTYYLLTH